MKKAIIFMLIFLFIFSAVVLGVVLYRNYSLIKDYSEKSMVLIHEGKYEEAFNEYFEGDWYDSFRMTCEAINKAGWNGKYYLSDYSFGGAKRAFTMDCYLESKEFPLDRFIFRVVFYKSYGRKRLDNFKLELKAKDTDIEGLNKIKKFAAQL